MQSENEQVFKAVQSLQAHPPLSIILADDDQMNLHVISRILDNIPSVSSNHVKIIQVTNGQDALIEATSPKNDVKLILMDCEMPIMDGFTAS
jgi:CheY-like chemotaxis protein